MSQRFQFTHHNLLIHIFTYLPSISAQIIYSSVGKRVFQVQGLLKVRHYQSLFAIALLLLVRQGKRLM